MSDQQFSADDVRRIMAELIYEHVHRTGQDPPPPAAIVVTPQEFNQIRRTLRPEWEADPLLGHPGSRLVDIPLRVTYDADAPLFDGELRLADLRSDIPDNPRR